MIIKMFNFSVGSSRRRKDKGRSKTLPNNVFDLKLFKTSNSPPEQMVSWVLSFLSLIFHYSQDICPLKSFFWFDILQIIGLDKVLTDSTWKNMLGHCV